MNTIKSDSQSDNQNFNGTSTLSWPLKLFFLSWSSLSASLNDYFRHSAKVFPKMLFAKTLLPKPVYPGRGSCSLTYSLPSFSTTELLTHGLFLFLTDYLNYSVRVALNWSIYDPVGSPSLGSLIFISLLGTPTISAAVFCSISEGGIFVRVWEETNLSLAIKSWPLGKLLELTLEVVFPNV